MSKKTKLSVIKWTAFWKGLGISIKKRNIFLRNYNPAKSDYASLMRIGIDRADIDKVRLSFKKYKDPLLFREFVIFFKKDTATVMRWTGERNISAAFLKLSRIFHYNSFERVKERFHELYLLNEMNRKGEKRKYIGELKKRVSIEKLTIVRFSRLLNLGNKRSSYKALKPFKFDNSLIYPIRKDNQVYKFLKISKENNLLTIWVSVDSEKEFRIIRNALRAWFGIYIDTPEVKGDFTKFSAFLKKGESDHFIATGVTYFDDNYRISIFPKYNKPENATKYPPYKSKISRFASPTEKIAKLRILHKDIPTKGHIFINFLTYQTGAIIGAVVLNLDDRGLNSRERDVIRKDFNSDFALPLNEFISCHDLDEKEIYRKLLQNTPKRSTEIELRDKNSLTIYKALVDGKLIPWQVELSQERYCINKGCRLGFIRKLSGTHCENCGERLLNDKKILVEKIPEEKIADFVCESFKKLGLDAIKLRRKLLKRNIFVVAVNDGKNSIEIVTLTKAIDDSQMEILRFRYPNLLIICSLENFDEFIQKDIKVEELYEFIYILHKSDRKEIKKLITEINNDGIDRVRKYAKSSLSRITEDQFYKDKNTIAKNFGAELFEADCSTLFSYIFGNSIWLGARRRGEALPDGITAFPITGSSEGCFVWDSKFFESPRVTLGEKEKNEKYIKCAKTDRSIIDNGGLKGFVFVSNRNAPGNFLKEFQKLTKKRRIKISFIQANHLASIFNHYKKYENRINNNLMIKKIFIESMDEIFFKTKKGKKSFILQDSNLDAILLSDEVKYKAIKKGKSLSI